MATEIDFQIDEKTPFQVTDLKQWAYCPRILYFMMCLPDVRPITYKMQSGIRAGKEQEGLELRRSLRAYGMKTGQREFGVKVSSDKLGLRGIIDLVIWSPDERSEEAVVVDYKYSKIAGRHFKLQLAAYGVLIEENYGVYVPKGYLYSMPLRKAEMIILNKRIRNEFYNTLDQMHRMLWSEQMPDVQSIANRCVNCEFKRFCNDVL